MKQPTHRQRSKNKHLLISLTMIMATFCFLFLIKIYPFICLIFKEFDENDKKTKHKVYLLSQAFSRRSWIYFWGHLFY